jgi:hypothetical protein
LIGSSAVKVESTLDAGTTFTIDLPQDAQSQQVSIEGAA